jgi:hypothetical protein
MANTYSLISSSTLAATATTFTFSAIPSTYTDLLVKLSLRTDTAGSNDLITYTLNGDSATNYSYTGLNSGGGTPASVRQSAANWIRLGWCNAATSTSNTFSNSELYLPSYLVSQNKPTGNSSVFENNNATDNYINANAGLYRSTTAISSITISNISSANFVVGSSFYLYGVKNA